MTPKKKATPKPAPKPPTVAEVAAALDVSEADVKAVYAAERAAQASVLNIPADWPPALSDALIERVRVALVSGPRTGSADATVRKLETDYSRRVTR